jgi:murein L,D-transpeptidase YcbB/YkuD
VRTLCVIAPGVTLLAACERVDTHDTETIRELTSTEEMDSTVRAFYAERDYRPAWTTARGLTNGGEKLVEALALAARDGLDPEMYGVADAESAFSAGDSSLAAEREQRLAVADIALTSGYLALLRDLRLGLYDPDDVQPDWDIEQKRDEEAAASLTIAEEDPKDAVAAARPSWKEYQRLSALYEELQGMQRRGRLPKVPETRDLRPGTRSHDVAALRARLLASEYPLERTEASRGLADNSFFDSGLARALRSFQERHGLNPQRVPDRATMAALNTSLDDRIASVRLNLERWRWMPNEPGERALLVNIAGYDLQALANDSVVLTMRTIVGEPEWRTPVFSDTVTYIVAHPYWNVPESILTEELLPRVMENDTYLVSNDYEVLDTDGNVIDGSDVDWSELDPDSLPYRIRQRPGDGNALGALKFMFPNQDNVYLHDTPEKYLFSGHKRAFSHGCVRVQRPFELAEMLLEWTGVREESLDEAIDAGADNERIELGSGVSVYLAYFTVRVDEDGRPRFLPDIYDLDRQMQSRLEATVRPQRVARMASR